MNNMLANTWVVLGLTALVVVGMFVLAALGKMDSTLAVGQSVAFVSGVLTAWKRGAVAPSEDQ